MDHTIYIIEQCALPITTIMALLQLVNLSRRVLRRGALGARTSPPPPPWNKVPLRNVQKMIKSSAQICRQKKNVHIPLRYHKIKTTKLGKKEENSKRKGSKLKK